MADAFSVEIRELKRAFARAKADRNEKSFVEYPFLLQWVEIDPSEWLKELQAKIAAGFNPHPAPLCWVPKAKSLLRPAHVLHLKDEVVYNLILGRLYEPIWKLLGDYQGQPDAAYLIREPGSKEWFESQFPAWENFRTTSLDYLHKGAKFVVASDITGFYENIDFSRLLFVLRQIAGGIRPEINLLGKCLRKWSARGDRGIPQGYSASDLLAKVYAHAIDVAIEDDGLKYLRYVDDIRVFCDSRLDAKRAILSLSRHVHEHGLNLQSAKTKILTQRKAVHDFDGAHAAVEAVQKRLVEELFEDISGENPYADSDYGDMTPETQEEPDTEVLETTFLDHFESARAQPFEKTLFHYLLNRLGKAESKVAVSYCLDALGKRPEETRHILKYFGRIALGKAEMKALGEFLVSSEAIYDYQCYQVLKWFFDEAVKNSLVLDYCRHVIQDHNRDIWLRSYAFAYLGKFGRIEDLQAIESLYSKCRSEIEKADCVMAMREMEAGRRNAFYGAARGDGPLVARAVNLAKKPSQSTR